MTGTAPPFVRVRGLQKRFGDAEVLRGIDLDVPDGEVVSIIGPSGSGKSTLLRILMTLDRPDAGSVEIGGEALHAGPSVDEARLRRARRQVGMVFQHFHLFPHMSVLQNVTEAPIHVLRLRPSEAADRARAYLERVGLGAKLNAYPRELSGGQKQRVAIARALAMRPRLMLFDEITSALDPELVGGILDLLGEISAAREATMLIVTHEMGFARGSSDRVLFMDAGRIVEDARPDVMFVAPTHRRTRDFLRTVLHT